VTVSLVDSLLQRIGVRPEERGLFGWGALYLLLLGAASTALMNTAETLFLKRVGVESLPLALLASSGETLFLKRVGVESLPLALLASSGLLVLTTVAITRVSSEDPARWLPRLLAGLTLVPLPFVLIADSRDAAVFGAMVLVSRQILALGFLVFWLAMGSLVPTRRAKQLFAPLASGATVGAILGSFGSGPLANLLGLHGLIAVCVGLLGGAALSSIRLRRSGTRHLTHALGARAATPVSADAGFVQLLRTSRLFRLLGVALLCGGALSPVVAAP